jgi:hypothetical protein
MIDLGCWPTGTLGLGDDNDEILDDLIQSFEETQDIPSL